MKRRTLLLATAGGPASVAAGPAAAADRLIGWITPEPPEVMVAFFAAFRSGLDANLQPGAEPVRVLERHDDGGPGTIAGHVNELQRLGVRVIVAQGGATLPVLRAGPSVPVVYGYSGDPVAAGVAQSLARPGGNATGVTFMAIELMPKRVDLVRAVLPGCRRIALLSNTRHPGEEAEIEASRRAVPPHGIEISIHRLQTATELQAELTAALDGGAEAVISLPSALMVQQAPLLAAICRQRRVPLISGWASIARAGALMTYGPNLADAYRRVAYQVVRILGGADPAILPIERPTNFELVVNRCTAAALGLELPPLILAQADEVIE